MKKISMFVLALCSSLAMSFAQALIPVSIYNFNTPFPTTLPTGWSSALTQGGTTDSPYLTNYTHSLPQAARLNSQGEYIQIWTAGQMGKVKYWLRGTPATGTSAFSGVFTVQESPDGTNWTTLHSFVNTQVNATSYDSITDLPLANSRYIRWYFTQKASGANIGLDDISIDAPILQVPEINATYSNAAVISGGYVITGVNVGDSVNLNINIQNQGIAGGNLTIGTPTITGTNAAEYTLMSSPSAVAPSSDSIMVVKFKPLANGTRTAVLTIPSNDSDENPYIINLGCTGGLFVTAPASQASGLNLSNIKSFRITGNFTGTTIDNFGGYLILKSNSPLPANVHPTDGKVYQRGDTVMGYKVIHSASATNFVASEVYANSTYHFTIWAYNGAGSTRNYLETNPLTANATTPATMMPANEYANINTSNTTFIGDLTTKCDIVGRNKIFYGNYGPTMMKLFAATDTFGGQKVATCVYSGDKFLYTGTLAWGYMSREHSYCHDWMPTNLADGTAAAPLNYEHAEYNDQHHLFPTNQNDVNAVRSNYPMGKVVTVQSNFMGSKYGLDSLGRKVFEPRDEQKGKTARAIMYMAVAYNNCLDSSGATYSWKFRNPISTSIPYGQDQSVLKRWNALYPPDSYEISRNDFIDSLQGNRNPFVDHPEYACYIDFSSMSYIANPSAPCYYDFNATCGTPTPPTIDSIGNNAITLSWTALPSATSYTIQYRTSAAQPWTTATTTNLSYTITGLNAATTYTFRIYATCLSGAGTPTSNSTFTTKSVGISEINDGTFNLAPNPNNGLFRVSTTLKNGTVVQVNLIDVSGRICFTEEKSISNSSFDINAANLPKGIYMVKISNNKGSSNYRMIIE
jgi:endonuclease I